jgi:hypothetical protein
MIDLMLFAMSVHNTVQLYPKIYCSWSLKCNVNPHLTCFASLGRLLLRKWNLFFHKKDRININSSRGRYGFRQKPHWSKRHNILTYCIFTSPIRDIKHIYTYLVFLLIVSNKNFLGDTHLGLRRHISVVTWLLSIYKYSHSCFAFHFGIPYPAKC